MHWQIGRSADSKIRAFLNLAIYQSANLRILRSSEHPRSRYRPPTYLNLADNVALGHEAPMAAVRAVVAMVPEHKVVALGNHLRAPIVVRPEILRDEVVFHRRFVDEH